MRTIATIVLSLLLLDCSASAVSATATTGIATYLSANLVTNIPAYSCVSTETTWGHDEFLEGFQTTSTGLNDGNSWSTNFVGTTANINPSYDISGDSGRLTGQCDRALFITVPTDGTETYVRWTNSALNAIQWWPNGATLKFAFNILYGLDTSDAFQILELRDDAANLIANIDLRESGGNQQVRAGSYTATSYVNITTNVWHALTLFLPAGTTNNAGFQLDSGTTNTFTIAGYGARTNIAKISLGAAVSLDATDACGPLKFDLLTVNTP